MIEQIIPKEMQAFYDTYHFAPAVKDGDHLRCSGMLGFDAKGKCPSEPESQFTLAFNNLKVLLNEAGVSFENIVEMTTFHVSLNEHMTTFTKVKDQFIKDPFPAWTAIGISELAIPGALVEIRVTARL